jgi:putative ABC transport system permease protein
MWTNYLKVALRTLRKQRGYTVINVVGLVVGLVCCGFIGLYIQDERSFDRYHERGDRIFRLTRETSAGGEAGVGATTAAPVAPALEAQVPEVEHAVRLVLTSGLLERSEGNERIRRQENALAYADAALFEVFSFPFLRGDPRTALAAPGGVVLTETLARFYFGETDPLGQPLRLDNMTTLTVTGVMRDIPANSHFTFDVVASWGAWEAGLRQTDNEWLIREWNANYLFTYLLLAEGTTPQRVEAALPAFVERNLGEIVRELFDSYTMRLQPLAAIHLGPTLTGEPTPPTDPTRLRVFALIGAFILLIACANFVNLATARAAQRAKEVGLRKSIGAQRGQLVGQFLAESLLVSGVAFGLAIIASALLLPAFNTLAGTEINSLWAHGGLYPLFLGALALVVGLGAGSYPALVLSGFRPAAVLRGPFRGSRQGVVLRKGLVVFQFAITIALLAGTAVVYTQVRYMRSQPLGFDQEQVLVVDFFADTEVQDRAETIRQVLARQPGVLNAAVTSSVPSGGNNELSVEYESPDGDVRRGTMSQYAVDAHFGEALGLTLIAGRPLGAADSSRIFLVNEAAVAQMGWSTPEEAIGKRFGLPDSEGEIVGVVRDFHYRGLREAVQPLFLHSWPAFYAQFALRLAPGDEGETVAGLERAWAEVAPHLPFSYTFLDETFDEQYRADAQFGQLFGVFAGLAILVACLGLFGLASYTATQRTKEIGVRKVLGASEAGIVALLSRDVVRLVLVAFLVSAPVAYLVMGRWLEGFAYRVPVSPLLFVAAGLAALLLALSTVSYQAVRAATADPVKALRYE